MATSITTNSRAARVRNSRQNRIVFDKMHPRKNSLTQQANYLKTQPIRDDFLIDEFTADLDYSQKDNRIDLGYDAQDNLS